MFTKNLITFNKYEYVKGKRPDVDCILCAISKKDKKIKNLSLLKGKYNIITLNLYPYNPGHLMIFPIKHKENLSELSIKEFNETKKLIDLSIGILNKIYSPSGFNIGWNIGRFAGASISHIHLHIVPRYPNETGFIDILGKTKILVEDANTTFKKLKKEFKKLKL